MANERCRPEFPRRYCLWKEHDLAYGLRRSESFRPEFYKGLRRDDEPIMWRFIEENYLSRYGSRLVRVEHEWFAEGLWRIPFPGSVSYGEYRSPRDYAMPGQSTERVLGWQAAMDRLEIEDKYPPSLVAEGLEVAKEVKLFLGDDHYVEFHPFREIAIRDGRAVELEVPSFITDLTR